MYAANLLLAAIFLLISFSQISFGHGPSGSDAGCPRRRIGLCFCPGRVKGSGFNSTMDSCDTNDDCNGTQKCCKVGCCGYRRCIEPKKVEPEKDKNCTGENEELTSCGNECFEACQNGIKPRPCPMVCVRGCFCKKSFYRNKDRKCVPRSECSAEESD